MMDNGISISSSFFLKSSMIVFFSSPVQEELNMYTVFEKKLSLIKGVISLMRVVLLQKVVSRAFLTNMRRKICK